ncbi:MAG: septal ring lytic transglycosylase RlpA family protein [Patescibacteria group bacterium]|nr:septal ring lytic transglycosylase RlpA family protein [Patescibacteria group bacterium]
MRKLCYLFLMTGSLLFVGLGVKALPAVAAELSGYRQFFLDQGFLGRAFKLDVDEFNLSFSFAADSIPQPGVLHLVTKSTTSTVSILGYKRFGKDVNVDWTTNAAETPQFVTIQLKDQMCGVENWHECAIEETFQGKTSLIRAKQKTIGSAEVKIHMGATVRLVEVEGYMAMGKASWYAYKKCPCAASPDFPKGTLVKVTNADKPSKTVVVKINDYGPERDKFPDRAIDLDKVAFKTLASLSAGVIKVIVEPLAKDDPAALAYNGNSKQLAVAKTTAPVTPPPPKPQIEWAL